MKRILVDTSALIALRDAGDANHELAVRWVKEVVIGKPVNLILTNYILSETHAFFCRTPRVAIEYVERIRMDPLFHVVRARQKDENKAWDLLHRFHDKTYSFVDALSFVIMEDVKITSAFSFDAHFTQYGRFTVLPSSH